jgi:hypothetical protein
MRSRCRAAGISSSKERLGRYAIAAVRVVDRLPLPEDHQVAGCGECAGAVTERTPQGAEPVREFYGLACAEGARVQGPVIGQAVPLLAPIDPVTTDGEVVVLRSRVWGPANVACAKLCKRRRRGIRRRPNRQTSTGREGHAGAAGSEPPDRPAGKDARRGWDERSTVCGSLRDTGPGERNDLASVRPLRAYERATSAGQ